MKVLIGCLTLLCGGVCFATLQGEIPGSLVEYTLPPGTIRHNEADMFLAKNEVLPPKAGLVEPELPVWSPPLVEEVTVYETDDESDTAIDMTEVPQGFLGAFVTAVVWFIVNLVQRRISR